MTTRFLVVLLIVLFAVPLWANPFGKSLILNGDKQYFEIPDSICEELANSNTLVIEIRLKPASSKAYNLFNKWRYYEPDMNRMRRSSFRGHGWLVDMNKSFNSYLGKIEMRYLDPLDGFQYSDLLKITRGRVDEDDTGWSMGGSSRSIPTLVDTWHHLTFVFDNTIQYHYIDGLNNGKGSSSNRVIANPGYSLNIGGFPELIDKTLDLSSYFDGKIDEIRIWNKVRTSEEIVEAMNDTLSPEIYTSEESGLIGYYRFNSLENLGVGNDGLENDVRDLSPSANHGNVWNGGQLHEPSVSTKIDDEFKIPVMVNLQQNYPNPFNPSTTIKFDLAKAGPVELYVYDVRGRLISTIVDSEMEPGSHAVDWASADLPSGVYLCRLRTGRFAKTIKMVLQK